MANSPGGILADTAQGHPPVFMSAGLQDNIFPIQQAGNAVSRKDIISDMLPGVSGPVYLPDKIPVNTGSIDCRYMSGLWGVLIACAGRGSNWPLQVYDSAGCLLSGAGGLYSDLFAVQWNA
jgi:hypothetical protein